MRVLLTPGEPAGIGPELAVRAARTRPELVLVGDPEMLAARAAATGQGEVAFRSWTGQAEPRPGRLDCIPVASRHAAVPGRLDPANAAYVLETLDTACDAIAAGRAAALVTGPVHKGVINDAGIAFSGHTEYLATRAGAARVVMMLVAGDLRVALATTHLPLADVPAAIARAPLTETLRVVAADLRERFAIAAPRIAVLGLNPHAGEGGHLGREEIEVIAPVVDALRAEGLNLQGPLPADTAFVPARLRDFDAVVAMYHDQGLPVLKFSGFGQAVNVTLGLPFVRTSVDHGTALDLAGRGTADGGSLEAAVTLAARLLAQDRGR